MSFSLTLEEIREWTCARGMSLEEAGFDLWLAETIRAAKEEAWQEGQRAESLAWEHIWDGHPVPEGEICDECKVENPYGKRTNDTH